MGSCRQSAQSQKQRYNATNTKIPSSTNNDREQTTITARISSTEYTCGSKPSMRKGFTCFGKASSGAHKNGSSNRSPQCMTFQSTSSAMNATSATCFTQLSIQTWKVSKKKQTSLTISCFFCSCFASRKKWITQSERSDFIQSAQID